MKEIPLTKGQFALVDNEDYDWLMQWKWRASLRSQGGFYVTRSVRRGGRRAIRMHRVILDAPEGMEVDQIDGNGLNNQRSNLRLATHAQNQWNRGLSSRNKSGYKGVWYNTRPRFKNRWMAYMTINCRRIGLGHYATAQEAALAFDKAAREHYGEFVRTNFQT